MALSQRLEFRQTQALVMTPQLMQAIKLLQLSSLDLAAYVEGELERNPVFAGDRFAGPALFVRGEKSGYVKPGDTDVILGHFPSARFEVIAGSGHNPHIEAREAFVRALTA